MFKELTTLSHPSLLCFSQDMSVRSHLCVCVCVCVCVVLEKSKCYQSSNLTEVLYWVNFMQLLIIIVKLNLEILLCNCYVLITLLQVINFDHHQRG